MKNLLIRFNHFFEEKQKLRYYLIFVIFSFVIGIILAYILGIISTNVDLSLINKTQIITELHTSYVEIQVPELNNSFFQIFKQNFTSGIIVLLLPGLFLLFIIYFTPKLAFLDPKIKIEEVIKNLKLFLKYLVLFISAMYAFRSFSLQNLYVYSSLLPLKIVFSSFSHAIFEIPAMIIPSVMSFYIIDEIYEINQQKNNENSKKKIYKLSLDIAVIIFILLIILLTAAYVESFITPSLTQQELENYLSIY